jgi:4-amino-4-deoxy-L-arabinose transferase-like glycosyltransferase
MPLVQPPYRQRGGKAAIGGLRLNDDRNSAPEARPSIASRVVLGAILLVAALLRGWNLGAGGVLVPYYFAGVRSMLQSWHNLLFNAFDPSGFVSLDKPPVAFWLQTASAKIFGFNSASVLLPQVLEGIAAAALLYWLVRRRFGVAAGLLAALFLALDPISVAVDRSNNTESCLVLVLLLSAWALLRAIETGRLLPLLTAAALVGIGFNVKMLVAFGVVPAFALVYLCNAVVTPWQRAGRLAAACLVLAPVALSWSLVYELTPPDDRPFVDSTQDNSMLELAVGHNFVQRFVRRAGFREAAAPASGTAPDRAAAALPGRDYVPAGPLRLTAPPLAAQIGWLLPLALIGGIAAWRCWSGPARRDIALWALWALAYGAVFSAAAGLFHSYYLVVMAPGLCALAGIGAVALWQLYRGGTRARFLLPAAILATGLWQAYVAEFFVAGSVEIGRDWLIPGLLAITAALTSVAVAVWRHEKMAFAVALASLATSLVLPAAWSVGTSAAEFHAGFPAARPPFETRAAQGGRRRWAQLAGGIDGDPKLIAFLGQSGDSGGYLVVATNARQAAPIIIATGEPVMALGGFSGRDPILSVDEFARLVAEKQVRFALVGDGSRGIRRIFGEDGQKALTDWIRENGHEVDPALWRGVAAKEDPGPADGRPQRPAENVGIQLYDLRPAAGG